LLMLAELPVGGDAVGEGGRVASALAAVPLALLVLLRRPLRARFLLSALEPRDGLGGLAGAQQIGADGDGHLRVSLAQAEDLGKGAGGLLMLARGLEGEAEVVVPLRLVGVQRDGLPKLGFSFAPPAGLEQLVGPLDVLFGLDPVAHGCPPRGEWGWGWGVKGGSGPWRGDLAMRSLSGLPALINGRPWADFATLGPVASSGTFRRDLLALGALCAVTFFVGLTTHGLTNWQEAQRALVAQDMAQRGDWLVPTVNGAPYLAKPPLIYWAQLAL